LDITEQILEAINLADAEFVQNYPKGLDTMMSEKYDKGIRPSGGQWQKISIARYFLRETNMLILDEPTSSIDAISEYNIFNNIYVSTNEKTVVIISHRFSTVRKADRIIVLDQGKIAEEGSHAELLKLDGIYAKSFEKQKLGYE
jgi:ATP-binding cassette subfamily B protein